MPIDFIFMATAAVFCLWSENKYNYFLFGFANSIYSVLFCRKCTFCIWNLCLQCVYILGETESDGGGGDGHAYLCGGGEYVWTVESLSQKNKQARGHGESPEPRDTLEHPVHQPHWVNTIHGFRWSIAL